MNIDENIILETAAILIQHFKQCINQSEKRGIHSRIFSHILHPEKNFVLVGQSQAVIDGAPVHPEHIVPCAVLIQESCRLIKNNVPDQEIAKLLAKHWRIAYISKEQAKNLDSKSGLNIKHTMPIGWCFETGDTFARLKLAGIDLLPVN